MTGILLLSPIAQPINRVCNVVCTHIFIVSKSKVLNRRFKNIYIINDTNLDFKKGSHSAVT